MGSLCAACGIQVWSIEQASGRDLGDLGLLVPSGRRRERREDAGTGDRRGDKGMGGAMRAIESSNGGIWEVSGDIWRSLEAPGIRLGASGGIWKHLGGLG